MPNRFEQVDEPRPDAITVSLYKEGDKTYGNIDVAPRIEGGRIEADVMLDQLEVMQALASAVQLANKRQMKIVIVDPDNLWQSEWGELYREA